MGKKEKTFSDGEIRQMVDQGRTVVVLFGAVYDLTDYLDLHPGGKDILIQNAGTDATQQFVSYGHLTKGRIVQTLTRYRMGSQAIAAKL